MYSTKVTNYPYICGCMEQNIPAIYAAPLQGFTEAAWRNAHEQTFGGVDAYYTPFIRLEKGEIRNKDKREVLPQQNTVSHLIPQLVASEPEELNQLAGFLASQGSWEGIGHIALSRKSCCAAGCDASVAGNPFLCQDETWVATCR